jgi:biopolymer transport protein ExbB/TolQ
MTDGLYQAVFAAARVLELPVIIVALASLAWLVVETGAFFVELQRRSRRRLSSLVDAADAGRSLLDAGNRDAALTAIAPVARNGAMRRSLAVFAEVTGLPGGETRMAKELADFDFGCQSRLGRTRLLVRLGPALGLMGTLIPLSPALQGLANGNITALTDNLRVAFSVTVLGILIGVVAFALSLVRERLYGQDYSDLEFVAAVLTAEKAGVPA